MRVYDVDEIEMEGEEGMMGEYSFMEDEVQLIEVSGLEDSAEEEFMKSSQGEEESKSMSVSELDR